MTDGYPTRGDRTVEGSVVELHTLAANLKALRRLLARTEADGSPIVADLPLIDAVIVTGREEMRSIRTLLAAVSVEPGDLWEQPTASLSKATAEADDLLDALERAVLRLKG